MVMFAHESQFIQMNRCLRGIALLIYPSVPSSLLKLEALHQVRGDPFLRGSFVFVVMVDLRVPAIRPSLVDETSLELKFALNKSSKLPRVNCG